MATPFGGNQRKGEKILYAFMALIAQKEGKISEQTRAEQPMS